MLRTERSDMTTRILRPLCAAALLIAFLLPAGCGTLGSSDGPRDVPGQKDLERGQGELDRGLPEQALQSFLAALQENPRLTEAHMGVGNIYRSRGDYGQAKIAYDNAMVIDPTHFEAHYYGGLMRHLLGEIRDAIRIYLQALAINPDSFEANRDLAAAYMQDGRPGEALPYAQRAVGLNPESQEAKVNLAATLSLLNRYADAVRQYREAAELGELADPVLLGLADAHLKLNNFNLAINTLNALIRRNPTSTAWERLGFAQYKLGLREDALDSFRTALELDETEVAAHNGVGVTLMTLYVEGGRDNEYLKSQALEHWRQSVALDPQQPRIIDLLSRYGRV